MTAVGFHDIASGREIQKYSAAQDLAAEGPNSRGKKGQNVIPARAIVYKGALTLTDVSNNSVALVPTTDYFYLPIQFVAVTGTPANDYMVIW